MHMEVTSKSADKATVIYVDGDLTTASSPEAEAEINEILEGKTTNVVINVERGEFYRLDRITNYSGPWKTPEWR